LVESHVHEVDRRPAFSDHLQSRPVLRVVKTPQFTIVDTEAIVPDVQNAFFDILGSTRDGRNGLATGVRNRAALYSITTNCLA
jgi:hypothetical protein